MTNLMAASNQWATRPDDQRFRTLEDLAAAVESRYELSHERNNLNLRSLHLDYDDNNNLFMRGHNGASVQFTNWSFGQFSTLVGAPAGYLRKLPAPLAKLNLEYQLESGTTSRDDVKLLYTYGVDGLATGEARAFTSTTYGRIYDRQIVNAIQNMNADGRWTVPTPFKRADGSGDVAPFVVDKRSTTFYASDRDVFIFLVDEQRPIEVDGQAYFRGFYVWNSETGYATFGLASFLYSYVCANRIIWDAREVKELRIKHSKNAPERFIEQAAPALAAMSEASAQPIIDVIHEAKATRLGKTVAEVEKWLASKGFGRYESQKATILAAQGGDTGSSGDPTNLWDVIQGGTAAARQIAHADTRTKVEREWSSLLRYAGKAIQSADTLPNASEDVF